MDVTSAHLLWPHLTARVAGNLALCPGEERLVMCAHFGCRQGNIANSDQEQDEAKQSIGPKDEKIPDRKNICGDLGSLVYFLIN